MDVRGRELSKTLVNGRQDWDGVRDRISKLKEDRNQFIKK
jgi:acetone carboxylase gamma subunit